jgi:cysteine desulfurase / selenocysteine lyase
MIKRRRPDNRPQARIVATMAMSVSSALPFDVARVRSEFPALAQRVHGHPLVYLDSAATAQKPLAVLDEVRTMDARDTGNVHSAVHALSVAATERYETARAIVGRFLGTAESAEIVFTRGTTESVNLVAQTFGRLRVGSGDEVLASRLEHHSNLVPWQMLCAERGARLVPIPLDASGRIDLARYQALLSPRTRVVAVAHVSNVLGTVTPIEEIVRLAHARGAAVLVDGAQAVSHLRVDVRALDCDFYCFSGHKLFGPTGAGVLYGKREHLEAMPPWQGGGHMLRSMRFEGTTYQDPPWRFEAGTPPIAAVVGLGAAITWLESIGFEAIAAHERTLAEHALRVLPAVRGLQLFGPSGARAPVFAFTLAGVHAHDVGTVLDQDGIAIRTGHHCAQPLMEHLGVAAVGRASLALYNTTGELDALVESLERVARIFRRASG